MVAAKLIRPVSYPSYARQGLVLTPGISGRFFEFLTELLVGTNTIIHIVASVQLSKVLAIIAWVHRRIAKILYAS